MRNLELTLLGLFGLAWLTALAQRVAGYPLAGAAPLDLYGFYTVAAAAGWLAGNLLVTRRAGRPRRERRLLLPVYLLGPLGPLYLLHTLGPAPVRELVPLAPLWAFGVFVVFFFVPVSLRR